MKNSNYYVVQGWMINELNLKGNELSLYAIIYGFSQDDDSNPFIGSINYLSSFTSMSRQSTIVNIKKLIAKGLIAKKQINIRGRMTNSYTSLKNVLVQKVDRTSLENVPVTSQKIRPNNYGNNDIDNDKEKNIKKKNGPYDYKEKIKDTKHIHGEYKHVRLTDAQLDKLIVDFTNYQEMITNLDEYIESTGKVYKNHNLTLRNWAKNKTASSLKSKSEMRTSKSMDNIMEYASQDTQPDVWITEEEE